MAGTQPERPMILGNCISCNGLMRVPVTTDVTHVARCPHCEVRFPVQQLIASAIPAAEIIEGEVAEEITPVVDRVREAPANDGERPRTKFEVPKQLHDGAKHRRRRRRRSRGSDERKAQAGNRAGGSSGSTGASKTGGGRLKIDTAAVPVASTESMAAAESAGVKVVDEVPTPSSSRERSSRASSRRSSSRRSSSRHEEETADSALIEWVKIALGGMIALPLAYLGLMWIAGLDPFGLANQINKAAPILVPSSLVDEETLPLSDDIEDLNSDDTDSLPKPSIDPDDVRG